MKKILISLLFLSTLSSCISRKEVEAAIWLNNFMGGESTDSIKIQALCERNPELKEFGFYRVLNTGKKEFISICNKAARDMLSIQKDQFNKMLDEALPKPQPTPGG